MYSTVGMGFRWAFNQATHCDTLQQVSITFERDRQINLKCKIRIHIVWAKACRNYEFPSYQISG